MGVAPEASYIACKALDKRNKFQSTWDVLVCGQFMLCPDFPLCKNTPHIVSNSWTFADRDSDAYNGVLRAWRAAGIIPVFSSGNTFKAKEYKKCEHLMVHQPAQSSHVVAVGAIDYDFETALFSNRGERQGLIKPDFMAPGVYIQSAISSQTVDKELQRIEDTVASFAGTSMATPFVSGTIALMITEALNCQVMLTFGQVYAILRETSNVSVINPPEVLCPSNSLDYIPNPTYGHGLINTFAAVARVHQDNTIQHRPIRGLFLFWLRRTALRPSFCGGERF